MYLGGNGLNCEVEFLDESTIVVHNGHSRRKYEESYDSRFHMRQESEANLLGVVYTQTGIMTAAPNRVVDGKHWVFEGMRFKNGDLLGEESLHMRVPGGASGHETDKISSRFSPSNVHLLAKGTNPDEGGAEMVLHERVGGGAVFSTGSITYLSSILVSEATSKITANVLSRFLG